jgi:hypothetical protein
VRRENPIQPLRTGAQRSSFAEAEFWDLSPEKKK